METVLNTTFVVHTSIEADFIDWLRKVYMPSIEAAGFFRNPVMSRVLTRIEPDTESIAVQAIAPTQQQAREWHDQTAALLKDDLAARWPSLAMHFTTYMEIIPAR